MNGLLLALAFHSPLWLAGLGLAVVPIIIHLLARRQFRVVPWGAMRFLLEAERENRRRVRLEQWLLLALRCLAMALLALVFSRPFMQPGLLSKLLGGGGPVQRILVIDNSASLAFKPGATSDFDALRGACEHLLAWLRSAAPGDPIALYLTSSPDTPLLESRQLDDATMADAADKIRRAAVLPLPAQPAHVLARIAKRSLASQGLAAVDLYVLSDFQRTDWIGSSQNAASPFEALQSQSLSSPNKSRTRLFLVRTGVALRSNLAVTDVRLERPHILAGQPSVLQVTLTNHSPRTLREVSLDLTLDGSALPSVTIPTVEAGHESSASAEVTFPAAGRHQIEVKCASRDGFTLDDVWRGSFDVRPQLSILLVDGAPSRDPLEDEVHLLQTALAPPGPLSSGYQVDVQDGAELGAVRLDAYDVVMLCNVGAPADTVVHSLEQFVAAGGGLFVSLGEMTGDTDAFNQAWAAGGAGLLPLKLHEEVRAESGSDFRLRRTGDDAVTALFPTADEPLSEYVHFSRFVRGQPCEASAQPGRPRRTATHVLARFDDAAQSPGLASCEFGRGRVLLYTSTVDLAWNDWARSVDGSYVIAMLEAVQLLAARSAEPPAFRAGQTLRVALSPEQFEPTAVFESPEFPADAPTAGTPVSRDLMPSDLMVLEGPAARRLGTYQVELTPREGPRTRKALSVNLDPSESDLAVATRSELSALAGDLAHEIVSADSDFLSGAQPPRTEMWRSLLWAMFGALLAEQALAWWFGGGRMRLGAARMATGAAATARGAA